MTPSSSRLGGLFLLFTLVNVVMAYSTWGPILKLWILFFGLVLPWVLTALAGPKAPLNRTPSFEGRAPFSPPGWTWVLLAVLSVGLRFYRIPDFFTYPNTDEFTNAYYAMHLVDQWDWHPFFHFSQLPPLYIWTLALIEKAAGVSPWALWSLPAALSLLALVAAYGACKVWFQAPFSRLYLALMGLSFWPLYLGRFSHQAVLMLFWEMVALYLLGSFFRGPGTRRAALLGLWVGLGFYTYFAWALVAVVLTLAFLYRATQERRSWVWGAVFAGCALVAVLPLMVAAWRTGYGTYLSGLLVSNASSKDKHWEPLQIFYYVKIFFWGTWRKYFSYGPWWGGFLNPLLGGCFFIGLLECVRFRGRPFVRWAAGAAVFLFVPVLFTNMFNALRLVPLMPLLLFIVAWGIDSLLRNIGPSHRAAFLSCLLLASTGLDLINLEKSRDYVNRTYPTQKTEERVRAYAILDKLQQSSGPGLVFSDFCVDFWDVSLPVVTYPFNIAENPRLSSAPVSWVALYTMAQLKPYLRDRWPHALWTNLDQDKPELDHFFDLAVVPASDLGELLEDWRQADRVIRKANYLFINSPQGHPRGELARSLQAEYHWFQRDPVLQIIFCEKYYFYCRDDKECPSLVREVQGFKPLDPRAAAWLWKLLADYDENEIKDYPQALAAIQKAVHLGTPDGFWYYQWGTLLMKAGRYQEAKKAIQEAGRLNPILVPPQEVLRNLDRLDSRSKGTAEKGGHKTP
jgi:tetratricopeptide (TPR) repeat protein